MEDDTPMALSVAQPAPPAVPLLPLLAETISAARAAHRDDLVGRLTAATERVRDPRRRILVAGQRDQGKSRFVNALLGDELCPVGDNATTEMLTVIGHGPRARAHLVFADGERVEQSPPPMGELATVGGAAAAHGRRAARLEIEAPNPLLADGIVLIDTPGIGGRGSGAAVLAAAPTVDAVLVLSDASTELTEPELAFLRQIRRLCPLVALVLTKTDLYPHWRRIEAADRAHLARAGLEVPVIAVSALLRAHALRLRDRQLGAESGFGVLYQFLREQVVTRSGQLVRAAVAADIRGATEHLALALGSELVALRDPRQGAAAMAELRAAKATAEELQHRTAAWQQTLADGITDLAGDVDHDLRGRLRAIARAAEEWIDEHDPGRHWDRLEEWLTGTVDSALGENLLWARTRAEQLSERVAAHFDEVAAVELPHVRSDVPVGAAAATLAELEPDIGFGSKLLVGMRGSYGGVLMVGLVSTFAGLALLNPISVGAGMVVGGKAFRDDHRSRLAKRRNEAKAAVRRYLDDVAFEAGKESKDRLHLTHRALRDHYAGVARRSLRSIDDSLRAAQEAASGEAARRIERRAVVERQLRVIAQLRGHADAVLVDVEADR